MVDTLQTLDINAKAARLAQELLKRGVCQAFGIPSSGQMLHFLDAFVKGGGQFVLCRHEASGPLMAGLWGRRSKKPAVALCADGTARMNLLSGISHCWFEKWPVITLWDSPSLQLPAFQKLQRLPDHDIAPFLNILVEGLGDNVEQTSEFLVQACQKPEPGPVGLHLRDTDVPLPAMPELPRLSTAVPSFTPKTRAKRPVLIFGAAACPLLEQSVLKNEFLKLPVPKLTAIGAKGLFPEQDPFSLRVFTAVGGAHTPETLALQQADLIIGINLRHRDVIKVKAFDRPAVLLDTERLDESTGFTTPQMHMRSADELMKTLRSWIEPGWTAEECRQLLETSRKAVLTEENESARACDAVSRLLYGKVTTVVDDGIYQKQSEYFWETQNADDFVATGVGRNMGSAIPGAVAIALQTFHRPVVCVTGDGGLPMYLAELSVLRDHQSAKVLILHFADFSLGTMRAILGQKKMTGSEQAMEAPFSYGKVLEGFGFRYASLSGVDRLMEEVNAWHAASSGCLFVEYRLKRDTYPKTFFLIR